MENNFSVFNTRDLGDFINHFTGRIEEFSSLAIKNSLLFSSFDGKNELMYYDAVFKRVFGADHIDGLTERDFAFLMYRMRLSFLDFYSVFLNFIVTPKKYAKFADKPEITIRKWMDSGRLNTISISGKLFIVIQEAEIMEFNKFLMKEKLEELPETANGNPEREKMQDLYRKIYGEHVPSKNSVMVFFREMRWIPDPDMIRMPERKTVVREKRFIKETYYDYCHWCLKSRVEKVTIREFSKLIVQLGFKRFNTTKRGFYIYEAPASIIDHTFTERITAKIINEGRMQAIYEEPKIDLAELYDLDEVEVQKEDAGGWKLPDFSAGWDGEEVDIDEEGEEDEV